LGTYCHRENDELARERPQSRTRAKPPSGLEPETLLNHGFLATPASTDWTNSRSSRCQQGSAGGLLNYLFAYIFKGTLTTG
jgi:hypothetical protein